MGIKYKLTKDGKTVDLSMRISSIANGWVIKAGGAPYFCFTEGEVQAAIADMLAEYLSQTEPNPKE